MPDNYDAYIWHEARQERALKHLPTCCLCCEPIQQDDAVYLDDWYCDDCLRHERRIIDVDE